jgi:hypothetical protein
MSSSYRYSVAELALVAGLVLATVVLTALFLAGRVAQPSIGGDSSGPARSADSTCQRYGEC